MCICSQLNCKLKCFLLVVYVDVVYACFGTILNIFSCLETLCKPRMYLIKLASAIPLSYKSLSLSSLKFDVSSIDETAETSFNGFRVSPN